MSGQTRHLTSDTDSESESDGGMQLDLPGSIDGVPMRAADLLIDNESIDGVSLDQPGLLQGHPMEDVELEHGMTDGWSIHDDIANEAGRRRHTNRSQNPQDVIFNRPVPDTEPLTAFEEQARMRSDFSDEKYAALAVLKNRELLMTYALANNETIPQTRRRFMAKYLEPDDPEKAEELYDPRIYIAPSGKGGEGSLIRGRVREYIGDPNDHGWHKPAHVRALERSMDKARSVSGSGTGSGSVSGANSPRFAGVGNAFGSRSASASASPMRGREDEDEL